jgi:hypothetical protein
MVPRIGRFRFVQPHELLPCQDSSCPGNPATNGAFSFQEAHQWPTVG